MYLVTGREQLPEGISYLDSLEETVRDGHVSVVQIRYVWYSCSEKSASHDEFLQIARDSLTVCDKVCCMVDLVQCHNDHQ